MPTPFAAEQFNLLNNITQRILGNEDLQSTSKTILDTLKTHMDAYGGVIYLPEKDSPHLVTFAYSSTSKINNALGDIVSNVSQYRFPVMDSPLISRCYKENQHYTSNRLSDFYDPVISARRVDIIQKLLGVKLGVVFPIRLENKPRGVLFVAFKQYQSLTPLQTSLLTFYANLSGIAIDNSLKYKELTSKYQQEKITTSMLNHELKTPIAIAHNSSQLLKRYVQNQRDKLGDMEKDFTSLQEEIDDSVKRLNYICGSIFGLIDSESKDMSVVHKLDLERQLEQVVQTYRQRAEEKGLDFLYKIDAVSGEFYGGGVQLEQVITILLDNAVNYTSKGSVSLNIQMDRQKIFCEVTDTGSGIPNSKKKAVFQRFYRNQSWSRKRPKGLQGLGLGLYVAQRIVERLQGSIEVHDNPVARGSQFWVEIPVYDGPPQNES